VLFATAFAAIAGAMYVVFALEWPPTTRLVLIGLVAFPLTALTSSFHYYLTELFPTELRGTGVSFCMNAGRLIMVLGPMTVGAVTGAGVSVLDALTWAAFIPVIGFVLMLAGIAIETRGQPLDQPSHEEPQ
jgi:MFS family permease